MLRACLLHLALIALSLPFAHMCGAQDNEPAVQATLRVGVRVAQPFVIAQEGGYGGLAIDLWEQIASEQGWAFEYREVGLNTLFDQVSAGELDIGLGALTVTAEREQRVDFSHPFHSGGLGIAVAAGEPAGIAAILQRLLSWRFLAWIGGLTVLLAAVGAAAWALERRANPEQFGGTPLQGMGSGFWWAAVTMATVGYGDKAPLSFAGRLLGLVWMFTAIILVATFTAGITASLTVGALQGRVQGAEDLPRVRVATVNASTGAAWLQGRGIDAAGFDRPEQALQALATGKLDAVVYDAPILQYLIRREHADSLSVLPGQLDRQNYALVLRPGQGTQREQLNRSLLRALDRPSWRRQLDEYLGREN